MGLGSGSGGQWGVVFLWKIREKGKGMGRMGGGEVNAQALPNYPLANYP